MTDSLDTLQFEMNSHDLFFRHIISMIPRDLYKPEEEEDEEVLNKRYHKHRKLPLDAVEKKVITKKKIKEKYEQAVVETLSTEREEDGTTNEFTLPDGDDGLDSLRRRLQERIEHLKQSRNASDDKAKEPSDRKAKRDDGRKKTAKFGTSASNGSSGNTKKGVLGAGSGHGGEEVVRSVSEGVLQDMLSSKGRESQDGVEDGGDIMYSGLVDSAAKTPHNGAGQPGSKTRRLQRMIADADKKRLRQEQLKAMGEEGKQRALAEQWTDVMQEASGEKVLVNTAKIKKVLKRREKVKEKSAKEWQERLHEVETSKAKKQEKREENLLKRKRGADYVEPVASGDTGGAAGGKKKAGTPIGGLAAKKGRRGEYAPGGSRGGGEGRPSAQSGKGGGAKRAGFEGKKTDFLNKKKQ